jgi:hypothetical protein
VHRLRVVTELLLALSEHPPSSQAVLALAVALTSLALLPFVPILPGLGSVLAIVLGALAAGSQRVAPRRWLAVAAIVVGGGGLVLALAQLVIALAAALGVGPW